LIASLNNDFRLLQDGDIIKITDNIFYWYQKKDFEGIYINLFVEEVLKDTEVQFRKKGNK